MHNNFYEFDLLLHYLQCEIKTCTIANYESWKFVEMNVFEKQQMTAMDHGTAGVQNNIQPTITDCKLYKRRWPMLLLFVLCSMANAIQWIQYSIIPTVIMNFYNVSSFTVDLTSIVYMITYIPLIFPASWILDKMVIIILYSYNITCHFQKKNK